MCVTTLQRCGGDPCCSSTLVMFRPAWKGHHIMGRGVCPSVCRVPRHDSRTERPTKPKIGRMEARHNSNSWSNLEIRRSKVKVTKPINAHRENAQYRPNGKAYGLQIWYTDGARKPASPTTAVTSKAKDQDRKVTWYIWQVLADTSRTKRSRNTEIGRKVAHPMAIMRTSFKVKRCHQVD